MNSGIPFNGNKVCCDPQFGLLPLVLRLPLLVSLAIFFNGSVLPPKPRSEERETGTNESSVGGSQKAHFGPVGLLLFWVSCVVDCANDSSLISTLSDGWLGLATRSIFSVSLSPSSIWKNNLIAAHMKLSVAPSLNLLSSRFHELLSRARQHLSLSRFCSVPSVL